MMAKCPSCNAEIDHLDSYCDERHYFYVRLAKEDDNIDMDVSVDTLGLASIEERDTRVSDGPYCCPECKAELTHDEKVVVNILKGGE